MSLLGIEDTNNYRYGLWKIDGDTDHLADDLRFLSIPEFKSKRRKQEYLAVRQLAHAMGVNPQSISYTVSGKPFLKGLPETHISISHSRHYAAFMTAERAGIGIDLEEYSPRILKIRSKFLSQQEELNLSKLLSEQAHTSEEELKCLYLHWCAKEAMFKALDTPGIDFKEDLFLDSSQYATLSLTQAEQPKQDSDHSLVNQAEIKGRLSAYYYPKQIRFCIDYVLGQDYVLTCCFSV